MIGGWQEGWPLGLQPLHVRVGLAASNHEFSGSVSFNTLLTGSPTSSTDSSSDLDTEVSVILQTSLVFDGPCWNFLVIHMTCVYLSVYYMYMYLV